MSFERVATAEEADRSPDWAIRATKLGKCYHIYGQPRDRLLQMLRGQGNKRYREFWALRDVSFQIKKGETVGIVGRNGSGKSTLLQLICGTLNPTTGGVEVKGRVAALLELGAGFNPEFSGHENVYLNGSVLGLTRSELDAAYSDIVAFADIGDFINQPVKTYSSGMVVRLAFAIAMHVSPDILLVDEALSVGDIAFRNKCLEAIQGMVARGVTIVFVTHDLGTLQLICSRAIWLQNGVVRGVGDPVSIAQDYYLETVGGVSTAATQPVLPPVQQHTGKAAFSELAVLHSENGRSFRPGQPVEIRYRLHAQEALGRTVFSASIYSAAGEWLVGISSRDVGTVWPSVPAGGELAGTLILTPLCLVPGDYLLAVGAFSEDYSICYALTDLCQRLTVRSAVPFWGKFLHPCRWLIGPRDG